MRGLAIVAPTSFGDTSLPRIGVKPVPLIAGASVDWAADNLPIGPVKSWPDLASGLPLTTTYGSDLWPDAALVGPDRVLRFDGANDLLETPLDLSGVKTLILVGRLTDAAVSRVLTSGGSGAAFNIYVGSTGVFAFNNGSVLASTAVADTALHVFIVVANGTSSVFRIDGTERTGTLAATTATKLRLGATGSAFSGSEIKRVAILPYAAGPAERAALQSSLKAHYGL